MTASVRDKRIVENLRLGSRIYCKTEDYSSYCTDPKVALDMAALHKRTFPSHDVFVRHEPFERKHTLARTKA